MASMTEEGIDLILSSEAFLSRPYWPGGHSGITLGYGYDLAHHAASELEADWLLPSRLFGNDYELKDLVGCVGLSGAAAAARENSVRGIKVSAEGAMDVFRQKSLPKYEAQTRQAFPGIDELPDEAYSALVSLVFNRGTAMGEFGRPSWESRREMREIKDAVVGKDLQSIAYALRSMKRLWEGQGLGGLLTRREKEAEMIESA